MSEGTPPLRLRPRLHSDSPPAPPPVPPPVPPGAPAIPPPVPAASVATTPAAPPSLSLRPRESAELLGADSAAPTLVEGGETENLLPFAAATPAPVFPPPASAPEAHEPGAEHAPLKLRAPVPVPGATLHPPPVATPPVSTPPMPPAPAPGAQPPPLVPEPGGGQPPWPPPPSAPPSRAPFHVRAPAALTEGALASGVSQRPEQHPAFRMGVAVVVALALLMLAGGSFAAWWFFLRDRGLTVAEVKESVAESAGAVARQTVGAVGTDLAAKAREALASQRSETQAQMDRVAAGDPLSPAEPKAASAPAGSAVVHSTFPPPLPPATAAGSSPAAPSVAPAPAPVAAAAPAEALPEPSAPFRRFVDGLRINGVFQGNPPRVLIDGRTMKPGDTFDGPMGYLFVGIDAQRKVVILREPTGAQVEKRY